MSAPDPAPTLNFAALDAVLCRLPQIAAKADDIDLIEEAETATMAIGEEQPEALVQVAAVALARLGALWKAEGAKPAARVDGLRAAQRAYLLACGWTPAEPAKADSDGLRERWVKPDAQWKVRRSLHDAVSVQMADDDCAHLPESE